MDRNDLKDLSREELVDTLYYMLDDSGKPYRKPEPKKIVQERKRLKHRARVTRTLATALGILVVVAAVAVLISTYLFPVIQVSGDSMEPTLSDGDVLVLLNTDNYNSGQLCCISWQNKLLIKRVIATSGDLVDIDERGNVYVNGSLIDEPYVSEKGLGECDIDLPYLVPEGKFFVLGDRRMSSIDSRSSAIGCVDGDQLVGKVLGKVWPVGK